VKFIPKGARVGAAVNVLQETLRKGPAPAAEMEAESKRQRISQNSLGRARTMLRVTDSRNGTTLMWALPPPA
jgi:hypothetical protein